MPVKLFVVGFPRNMEEIRLLEWFSAHGIVETVTIVTDQVTGLGKGYGFLTMADDAGAARAIAAFDGAEIEGRKLAVRVARNKDNVTAPANNSESNNRQKFGETTAKTKRARRPRTSDSKKNNMEY